MRELKPDIIHTYLSSANSYGRIAAMFLKNPVLIASERSSYELGKDKTIFGVTLDKILSYTSSAVICNTKFAANNLIEKYSYNNKKVFTIHNGYDSKMFELTSLVEEKNTNIKIIGMVANHMKCKNYELFLDTALEILRKYNNAKISFITIGDGPLRSNNILYAKKLGIHNKVIFARSTDNIQKYLKSMDIFISTSNYEGFSNALMEAMAAGLSCVATDVGGNSELIVDGKNGFIVQPRNPIAIAEKVLILLKNEEIMEQLGLKANSTVKRKFTIENMVSKTETLYNKLLARKI